jgi:hypothetical protein
MAQGSGGREAKSGETRAIGAGGCCRGLGRDCIRILLSHNVNGVPSREICSEIVCSMAAPYPITPGETIKYRGVYGTQVYEDCRATPQQLLRHA